MQRFSKMKQEARRFNSKEIYIGGTGCIPVPFDHPKECEL